jgi:hypothetical protein
MREKGSSASKFSKTSRKMAKDIRQMEARVPCHDRSASHKP